MSQALGLFGLCFLYLRNVKGFGWNHKRVYRIYRELELNLRIKPHKRERPKPLVVTARPSDTWSMDFMAGLFEPFMCWITSTNREGLGIEVDVSLPSEHVTHALWTELSNGAVNPGRFVVITDRKISVPIYVVWAETRGIQLDYIQPGKPQQNTYLERYNRTVRHEWLEMNEFPTIEEAQLTATQWLWIYNNERPNMALGGITPAMKLAKLLN